MSPELVVVTSSAFEEAAVVRAVAAAAAALAPGALAVQVRDKEDPARRARLARLLRAHTRALLVVNGDLALARELAAEGLHLPPGGPAVGGARAALPGAWISVPAHDDAEVRRALAEGADAVLVSPVFATPGKGPLRGLGALTAARALAPGLGVYALGGVDASNAARCRAAGASGVAVVRAILAAPDPADAARALVRG